MGFSNEISIPRWLPRNGRCRNHLRSGLRIHKRALISAVRDDSPGMMLLEGYDREKVCYCFKVFSRSISLSFLWFLLGLNGMVWKREQRRSLWLGYDYKLQIL